MHPAIGIAERGLVPDAVIRLGIRRLLDRRLQECRRSSDEHELAAFSRLLDDMDESPLAMQLRGHKSEPYKVPPHFFQFCLGPRLKYSSYYFKDPTTSLVEAEVEMLRLTCERAGISDGMTILELGCGWGSLSLWMAEYFPRARVFSLAQSEDQKMHIDACAERKGLKNLTVVVTDMNQFSIDRSFDRVISVEMFEHTRDYRVLFERISNWLKPEGKLFFHIFCHAQYTYAFGGESFSDWMGKSFFTGGIMPAYSLPLLFQEHLKIERQWKVSGIHCAKTAQGWLDRLDQNRALALLIFKGIGGPASPAVMVNRWRIFFMACAELFKSHEGREWFVGHYLFAK